jgi:hypothetical protein
MAYHISYRRVFFTLLAMMLLWLLTSCNQANLLPIERDFTTMDLLLAIEAMPSGWEVVEGTPRPMLSNDGGPDDSYILFKPATERANMAQHFVWRFDSLERAERWYERRILSEFNNNSIANERPWETPATWSFSSPNAQKFHAACAVIKFYESVRVCNSMWQYDEFVIVFSSSIRPEYFMTEEKFEEIVEEIDRILTVHLER